MSHLRAPDAALVKEAVSRIVAPTRSQTLLANVVRDAARLCDARLAAIALQSERPDQLELVDVFGTGGLIAEKRLPVPESLNGMAVTSERSFRSPDVWRDRRAVVRDIARRNKVRGVLIVPLVGRRQVVGTLSVASRAPREFSARDESVLEALAAEVAFPIEDACLRGPPWDTARRPAGVYRLTPRERDILRLLLADCTCKQVAAALGLSGHTVRHYVERLKLRFARTTLHGLLSVVLRQRLLE